MEESLSPAISDFELVDEEFTQSPSGPFIVKESPGRGQGIFSARNVGKGERILMEKPFFVVSKEYNQQTVLDAFEHMSLSRRKQYMQLTCPDRWDDIHMTDVMRIFEANCFNIGNRAAMFLTATRFNHSCVPNTYYSWNENRSEIVFQVMIDISENEEMTICYGNPFRTFLQRRHELRIYSFRCHCPACQIETPFGQASQSRRLTMRDLEEQIIMFQSMLNEALLCYGLRDPLTVILRLIQLIKEEGLHGELMTPYRDAADYLKGRGNIEEALKFAHLELEEEVVCLGNDSDVVHKTVEYIKKLEVELKTWEKVRTMQSLNGRLRMRRERNWCILTQPFRSRNRAWGSRHSDQIRVKKPKQAVETKNWIPSHHKPVDGSTVPPTAQHEEMSYHFSLVVFHFRRSSRSRPLYFLTSLGIPHVPWISSRPLDFLTSLGFPHVV